MPEVLINEVVALLTPLREEIGSEPELPDTLFEKLGGAAAIDAVVELMYQKIFVDPELSDFFRKTDKEKQKDAMKRFLTYATGGSKEWTGKSIG